MLYIHSGSAIEKVLAEKLSHNTSMKSVVISDINKEVSEMHDESHHTLVYSVFDLVRYTQSAFFEEEIESVQKIISYAITMKIKQIIVFTYPGAYPNSDNKFLRQKGLIEKLFTQSNLHVVFLNVQAVYHTFMHLHNLHPLFYKQQENKYVIPQKSNLLVYGVSLQNLINIILQSRSQLIQGHYDVFDSVSVLEDFLEQNSKISTVVQRVYPVYLQVLNILGQYLNATLLDLFIRPAVYMYNFRTEKKFHVDLHSQKQHSQTYYNEHDYHVSPVFGTKGFSLSTVFD